MCSQTDEMLSFGSPPANQLLDDAIVALERLSTGDGWFGPARNAFDALTAEFRHRLVVLAMHLRTLE